MGMTQTDSRPTAKKMKSRRKMLKKLINSSNYSLSTQKMLNKIKEQLQKLP
jgi:hypothetical protein